MFLRDCWTHRTVPCQVLVRAGRCLTLISAISQARTIRRSRCGLPTDSRWRVLAGTRASSSICAWRMPATATSPIACIPPLMTERYIFSLVHSSISSPYRRSLSCDSLLRSALLPGENGPRPRHEKFPDNMRSYDHTMFVGSVLSVSGVLRVAGRNGGDSGVLLLGTERPRRYRAFCRVDPEYALENWRR